MSQDNTSTTTLNTLIGTLLDSIDGYQKSAQDTSDQDLAQRFQERARERQQGVATLQAAVARLGGNPEDDGTLLGSAHRAFLSLKEAVVGSDRQSILNEVDRGEDYLKEKFQAALNDVDLAPEARSAVEEVYRTVKSGHDEMSRLKHQNEGYRQGVADARQQEYAQSGSQGQQGASYSGDSASRSGGQTYAQDTGLSASNETFAGGTTGGSDQRPLTGTDTYQQQAGGYPGTIGSETGTTKP